jgi:hypothetical protein
MARFIDHRIVGFIEEKIDDLGLIGLQEARG